MDMTDKELLQELMKLNGWTQARLAAEIGFNRVNVTKIFKDAQRLSNTSRKVCEQLLKDSEPEKTA